LPHLAAARHLLPTDADVRRELALAWLSASRLEEARTEALALLQLRPDDPAGWLLLAEASTTPEHLRAARELLRPADNGGALDVLQETALAVLDLRERKLD